MKIFSYSVIWPTKVVQRGDECTRDYLFGIGEERQRSARLTAWFHTPQNYFIRVCFLIVNVLQYGPCMITGVKLNLNVISLGV